MVSSEIKQMAAQRAGERARAARWDLDVAVFLFAVFFIVVILLFQGVTIEIVAPVAVFSLAMVWLVGWRRGRQLYKRFYNEELSKLRHSPKKTEEETIEERIQRALRERGGEGGRMSDRAGVPQQASRTIDITGLIKEKYPR